MARRNSQAPLIMKGSLSAILVRCLWLALALLVSTAHGGPVLSQLRPRAPAGETIPGRSINLDELTPEAYTQFLEQLRGELETCRRRTLHVLPPQTPNPTADTVGWFDLGLHTGGFTVNVRLQSDNLYLLGYQVPTGSANPVWHVLSDAVSLMPTGSAALPGGFTYSRLETAAELRRPELPLGLSALRGAVSHLATHLENPSNREERRALAKALLVMVQMLCEALRFSVIAEHVSHESARITERMARLENDWADISEAVLRGDREYTESTPLLANENQMAKWELRTLAAAIAILGLALQPSVQPPGGSGRSSSGRRQDQQCGLKPQGRTLLEVYYVRINNIDGEDPGDLYGTIKVTDALGTETIFSEDWLYSISPGQDVPLTGPARAISGSGAFSIDLDLWDRDRPPDVSPNDEVARGSIQWNPEDPRNAYDQTHYEMITGASGAASVQYAVLHRAVTATVSVTLVKGDENPDDVCGTITATTKMDSIVLFARGCHGDTSVSVGEGQAIPLQRTVLAVALDDVLTVEARLWDWDRLSDDEIANGKGTFAAMKDTKRTINGEYGTVDVNVEWSEL